MKTTGSALVAAITLTFGIGLLGLVFSIYDVLFLHSRLPDEASLLVIDRPVRPGSSVTDSFSRDDNESLRAATGSSIALAAIGRSIKLKSDRGAIDLAVASANIFDVIGLQPAMGRLFTERGPVSGDDYEGQVVLTSRGRTRLFDGSDRVVGSTLRVGARTLVVVGVLPPNFTGLYRGIVPDAWVMLEAVWRGEIPTPSHQGRAAVSSQEWRISSWVGRGEGSSEHSRLVASLADWSQSQVAEPQGHPVPMRVSRAAENRLEEAVRALAGFSPAIILAALVLIGGTASVLELLIARLIARRREAFIRFALGGTVFQVSKQALIEILALVTVSAVVSLIVVWRLAPWAGATAASVFPRHVAGMLHVLRPTLDFHVAVVIGAALIVVGVVAASIALTITNDTQRSLNGPQRVARIATSRLQAYLVALQVLISMTMVVTCLTFMRAAYSVAQANAALSLPGRLLIPPGDPARQGEVLRRLQLSSQIQAVSAVALNERSQVSATNGSSEQTGPIVRAQVGTVSASFFNVMNLGVVSGRTFDEKDAVGREPVAVLNKGLHDRLFPGSSGVGQVIAVIDAAASKNNRLVVVGVVSDVAGAADLVGAIDLYLPGNLAMSGASYPVAIRQSAKRTSEQLMMELALLDPTLPDLVDIEEVGRGRLRNYNVAASITAVTGGCSALLTCFGVFSMLTLAISRRSSEIALRVALGATPRAVVASLIKPFGRHFLAAAVLGVIASMTITATLRSIGGPMTSSLSGLTMGAIDIVAAVGLIGGCVALALAMPLARALRISPSILLRD